MDDKTSPWLAFRQGVRWGAKVGVELKIIEDGLAAIGRRGPTPASLGDMRRAANRMAKHLGRAEYMLDRIAAEQPMD